MSSPNPWIGIIMTRSLKTIPMIIVLAILIGCAASGESVRIDPTVRLTVEFYDAHWNGLEIPVSGQCGDCGGMGNSPALRIRGLPAEANEVIVEFNDLRIPDLAEYGGHGSLAVATGGRDWVVLPSVREESMSLPVGVRCVHKHRCVVYGHRAGAYKAPCGCGQGNEYVAVIKAVRRSGEDTVVLAVTEFALGIF